MMYTMGIRLWTSTAILLLLSGCVVRREQIVSPFQRALRTYYKAASSGTEEDLQAAIAKTDTILERNPGDMDTRILRANLMLLKIRSAFFDVDAEQQLLRDLRTVAAAIGNLGTGSDWVPAHALVVMGDYLTLKGVAKLKDASVQENAPPMAIHAKALFDGARYQYAAAIRLADQASSSSTAGLAREDVEAQDGLLEAIRGALEALDKFDPPLRYRYTRESRAAYLQIWQDLTEKGTVLSSTVGKTSPDPSEQASMRDLYVRLSNDSQRQVQTWCRDHGSIVVKPEEQELTPEEKKAVLEGEPLYSHVLAQVEQEAMHASLAFAFSPNQPGPENSISRLVFFYQNELLPFCKLTARQ